MLKALAEGQGPTEPRRGLLGKGLPVVREVVEALRAHPAAIDVSDAGSTRRRRETFRDLDVIATATDPAALTAHFVGLPWVLEVVAHGDTKATVITKQGLRLDLRVVPPESYGDLLQHFTGSKDHNVALREQAQRDGLSVSEYGVTVVETGEVQHLQRRGVALCLPRLQLHPARAARERRRARGGADGDAAAARRARRPARRDALPLDVVLGRQGDDRGDGARRGRPRLRVPLPHRPLALPPRGQDGGSSGARSTRSTSGSRPSACCAASRRTSRRDGDRRRPGRDARRARLGRRLAPHLARPRPDRARPRGDREPARRLHRAPDRPPDLAAPGRRPRPRARRRARRRRPAPRSRSTASPTGSTCATSTPGSPARPASRIPVNTDAHSTAALAYAELGIGQARRAWLTKEQVLNTRPWAEIAKGKREHVPRGRRRRPRLGRALPRGHPRATRSSRRSSRARSGLRCPRRRPRQAEPFAAVLRDLDEILMPGITHWQSPRYFAYFATTAAEPGILAELLIAGLNQVGILWRASPALQELEEVTLDWLRQLLGLPEPLHGHIEDTASSGLDHRARGGAGGGARTGASSSAPSTRTRRRLKAARLLELEVRQTPVDARVRAAAGRARPLRRLRGRRHRRHDLVDRRRSRRRDRRPGRRGGRLAPRRRRLRRRRGGVPRARGTTSPAGSGPTRSASTRTSGCSRRWTAPRSSAGVPTTSATRSASCPSTCA